MAELSKLLDLLGCPSVFDWIMATAIGTIITLAILGTRLLLIKLQPERQFFHLSVDLASAFATVWPLALFLDDNLYFAYSALTILIVFVAVLWANITLPALPLRASTSQSRGYATILVIGAAAAGVLLAIIGNYVPRSKQPGFLSALILMFVLSIMIIRYIWKAPPVIADRQYNDFKYHEVG